MKTFIVHVASAEVEDRTFTVQALNMVAAMKAATEWLRWKPDFWLTGIEEPS